MKYKVGDVLVLKSRPDIQVIVTEVGEYEDGEPSIRVQLLFLQSVSPEGNKMPVNVLGNNFRHRTAADQILYKERTLDKKSR